jgi:hypothetical protein
VAVLGAQAPQQGGEFVEVAATWPYEDRVRITAARRVSRRSGAVRGRPAVAPSAANAA